MKTRIYFWMVLLTLGAGASVFADEPTVKVGDPAPKLQMAKWVQGDPVTAFASDKAYIVEFWATWCGPCRASIPHLNEHYLKFKDNGLVVIGQDCWEQNDDLVAPFVKSMGDKMTYRVALDDKKIDTTGTMAKTWMAAAGQGGIPTAFLVGKDGKIAWIGHPMALEDSVIEQVLAGTYNLHAAAAEYAERTKNAAHMDALWKDFNALYQNKKWDEALTELDAIEALTPEDQRSGVGLRRFFTLIKKKDYAAANKVAEQVSDAQPANTYLQNELAWEIVSDATIEQRDLALAEKIAARAVEASKSKDGNILDTLACVLFMEGKRDRAVTVEEQAVNLGDNRKEMFQKTLEAYEKGTDKPDVLNRQAEQFKSDGELAKAEATWREELALEQKLWETNPARWAGTVQQLTDVLGMDKKTDDAEKLFASVLTPTFASQKESANMLRARGNFFAKHGRWKEAAADFAKVIALTPDDHYDFFVLAILQVQCGDWDAYQSLCAKILARFGETTNPTIAERMAKDCLFTGNSGTDLATVCKMADLAVTKGNSPYVQFVKGLAEYRQGHFASAAEYLPKALGGRDPYVNAGAELVLAMTQYQLKQTDAAQASLAKGAELIDSKTPKIDKGEVGDDWWNDWIINRVLLGEARKLVGTAAIVADRATSQPAK